MYSTTTLLVLGLILPSLGQTPTTGGSGGPALLPGENETTHSRCAIDFARIWNTAGRSLKIVDIRTVICESVSFVSHFFLVSFSLYSFFSLYRSLESLDLPSRTWCRMPHKKTSTNPGYQNVVILHPGTSMSVSKRF